MSQVLQIVGSIVLFFSATWASLFGGASPPATTTSVSNITGEVSQWTQLAQLPSQYRYPYGSDGPDVAHLVSPYADSGTMAVSTINRDYKKDATHVYYLSYDIANADPTTFAVFPSSGGISYARDASHVFCNGVEIPEADSVSFSVIALDKDTPASGYAKDRSHVYAGCDGTVKPADTPTFVALTAFSPYGSYAKDTRHVYWIQASGTELGGAWTFSVTEIDGADPSTFYALNSDDADFGSIDAADAKHAFLSGQMVR